MENKTWLVYVHTSPNGKRYVGITKRTTKERWGIEGKGYRSNKHFWSAICKYGWENFTHEVVKDVLSVEEACDLEVTLIRQFRTMESEYGYNQNSGGHHPTEFTNEVITKLSNSTKKQWEDPEYRDLMVASAQRPCSEAKKKRISKSRIGIRHSVPSSLKGVKLSEERKASMKGRVPWCKGKTKENESILKEISNKLKGRLKTDVQKEHQSKVMISKYQEGWKPTWVHKDGVEITVDASSLADHLSDGWVKGRLKMVYVHDGKGVQKRVTELERERLLTEGWLKGRGKMESISKSKKGVPVPSKRKNRGR